MITIKAVDRKGEQHTFATSPTGTLMEALRDHNLDVEAICGGCCSCSTCHVYVDPKWTAKLTPPTADEKDLLEGSTFNRPNESRLSCQVPLSDALNGIEVTVAPAD